jgi:folate-binding protein YgfZ
MNSLNPKYLASYEKALNGGVFFPIAEAGYLIIEGPDQIDFLQRQTSNDLNLLTRERSLVTVLLNPAARILDVLRLIKTEGALSALTLPGYAAETSRFLQSRIFFMDRVNLTDQSPNYIQIDALGPEASLILEWLGFSELPREDEIASTQIAGSLVLAIGQRGFQKLSFRLLAPLNVGQDLLSALRDAKAEAISEDVHHVLRVEAGLPAAGSELSGDYTPLEAGLTDVVSTTKGCYPGQEVIARQINYDKITRSMVGLHLETPVDVGARITMEGKAHGVVTSFANSPRFGPIALGIIKRPFNQPGTKVMVAEVSGDLEIPAQVTPLPFGSNIPA